MNLTLFVQLVSAAMRDEFNAIIITEGNKITFIFQDGKQYTMTVEESPELNPPHLYD